MTEVIWDQESQKIRNIFGECQNVLGNLWMSLDNDQAVFKNPDTLRIKMFLQVLLSRQEAISLSKLILVLSA